MLGFIMEWIAECVTWETDPRHVVLIQASYAIVGKAMTTPGVRYKPENLDGEIALQQEAVDRDRATTMQAQHLVNRQARDTSPLQKVGHGNQKPPTLDEMRLKWLS